MRRPLATRTSTTPTHHHRRVQRGVDASGAVSPHRGSEARNPALKIIVVDPRRTATAEIAGLHLAIEPGTDVALFHGMLHLMLWEEWVDGFIARTRPASTRSRTSCASGRRADGADLRHQEEDLIRAARWFAEAGAVLSLYCQGLNQSSAGTAKNAALINLHLATGQIGRPGAGPLSLTGQPNAMGGREVGGMATLMSAHRDLANAADRAEVAALWGVDAVPAQPGRTAIDMFDALRLGGGEDGVDRVHQSRAVAAGPGAGARRARARRVGRAAGSLHRHRDRGLRGRAAARHHVGREGWHGHEFRAAHLPGARRGAAPGEARADWRIAADFAQRLEMRLQPSYLARIGTLFPYDAAAEIFAEHAATTRGRDLDITGLSHAVLDAHGPQQWPFAAGAGQGTARLYTDGVFPTADGRARFAAVRMCRWRKPPMRAIRCVSTPGDCAINGTA